MQQLARVEHVRPGDHPNNKKRKRVEEGQCWKRRSTLWDLPYWSTLKLRHNLDVMHIEKKRPFSVHFSTSQASQRTLLLQGSTWKIWA
jgi:hypothetical protein